MRELTGLEKVVWTTLTGNTDSLEELQYYMQDIMNHGCQTGIVPELIYEADCEVFVKDYLREIVDTMADMLEEFVIESIPADISLIAWWTFEYITKKLYHEINWEDALAIESERTIEAEIIYEE